MKKHFTYSLLNKIFIIISLVILLDYFSFSKQYNNEIISIAQQKQQYYNAARNSHNTYKLNTKTHSFYISGTFASKVKIGDQVTYDTSLLFNEVNSYHLKNEKKEFFSLRLFSGLILPLLSILLFLIIRKKNHIILLIVKILIIFDLIYLIL